MSLRLFGLFFNLVVYSGLTALITVIAFFFIIASDLPSIEDDIKEQSPSIKRVYSSDGHLIDQGYDQYRIYVNYDNIPKTIIQAFISAEDKNFFNHNGIDLKGIIRASLQNFSNKIMLDQDARLIGASTITQQVVKNLILDNERTLIRKAKEIVLAIKLDSFLTKEEILEIYLNEIYFGRGAYGIVAASDVYFRKDISDLNVEEAAFLAALPKAPNNYDPLNDYDFSKERRDWVLDRMASNKYITDPVSSILKDYPLEVVHDYNPSDFNPLSQSLSKDINVELDKLKIAEDILNNGVYINSSVSKEAHYLIKDVLGSYFRASGDNADNKFTATDIKDLHLIAALPQNGRILSEFKINNTEDTNFSIDEENALEALKPIYYSFLLESDYHLNTKVLTEHSSRSKVILLRDTFGINNAMSKNLISTSRLNRLNEYLDFFSSTDISEDVNGGTVYYSSNLDGYMTIFAPLINGGKVIELSFIDSVEDKQGNILYLKNSNKSDSILNSASTLKAISLLCNHSFDSIQQDLRKYNANNCYYFTSFGNDLFFIQFTSDVMIGLQISLTSSQNNTKNKLDEFRKTVIGIILQDLSHNELKDFAIPDKIELNTINKDTGNKFNISDRGILELF